MTRWRWRRARGRGLWVWVRDCRGGAAARVGPVLLRGGGGGGGGAPAPLPCTAVRLKGESPFPSPLQGDGQPCQRPPRPSNRLALPQPPVPAFETPFRLAVGRGRRPWIRLPPRPPRRASEHLPRAGLPRPGTRHGAGGGSWGSSRPWGCGAMRGSEGRRKRREAVLGRSSANGGETGPRKVAGGRVRPGPSQVRRRSDLGRARPIGRTCGDQYGLRKWSVSAGVADMTGVAYGGSPNLFKSTATSLSS